MEGVSYVEYRALCDSYTNMVVKYMQQGSLLYAAESEVRDLRSGEYLARVIEERDRYRKALEFYAKVNSWRSSTVYMCGHSGASSAEIDRGNKARAALEAANEPT